MQAGISPFLVASTTMRRTILDDPRYYLNRHVQWLAFNRRVLEEACDPGNPLLERVKFLAITANNLDEFVEVRVSSFLQRIEHGSAERSPDGLSQRRKGWAVRLEIEAGAHAEIVQRLVTTFELDEPLVFRVPGMVNLQRLFHL